MSEEVKMKQGKENTGRARIQATLMLPVTNMITNSNIITNFGSFGFFFLLGSVRKKRET